MSKYTFQTVVVSAETREAFTSLREELNASDKALFEAIWLTVDIDKVKEKLAEVKPLFGRKKKAAVTAADVEVANDAPPANETPIEKIARKAAKKAAKKKAEPAPKADDDSVVVVVEEEAQAE